MDERVLIRAKIIDYKRGIYSGAIPPLELRRNLLYWDFIDSPMVNGSGSNFEANPETKLLKEQGFLRQTRVEIEVPDPFYNLASKEASEIYLKGQFKLAENYRNKSVSCAVTQPNPYLIVPEDNKVKKEVLEIELFNCLPFPSVEVPIDKILNFKEIRKDELLNLRRKLDLLYFTASNNLDDFRAKDSVIKELNRSIIDINRLFEENKFSKVASAVKVLVQISLAMYGGYTAGEVLGEHLNMTPIESQVIGAVGGLLSIKASKIYGPKSLPEYYKDFAYLYYGKQDLKM